MAEARSALKILEARVCNLHGVRCHVKKGPGVIFGPGEC